MGQTFNHLSLEQRKQIKKMLDSGCKKTEIAQALNVHRATIRREIERGSINGQYDPNYSDEMYHQHMTEKGPKPLLSLNPQIAQIVAQLILEENLSPAQVAERLKEYDGPGEAPKSALTIYNAIDNGLIPGVTRESLNSNVTTVFSNGTIHIARWARNILNIEDGDKLYFKVVDNKLILEKIEE